jgi:hypothetical protein
MRPRLTWTVSLLAFLAVAILNVRAENSLTLPVDLDEIRGRELIQFMRAAVPEVWGAESRQPHDLSTLARLHAHFVANAWVHTREDELSKRDTQQRLEGVLRAALGKVDLPELRRITLGDGKRDFGNGQLFPALCQRSIEAEVKKILSEPKPKLDFPADAPALPEHLRLTPVAGSGNAEYERAVGPFAKLLADLAGRSPRGIHAQGAGFDDLTRAFLLDRDKKIASELLRFTWDSWCGTGAAEFEGTKMTLVMMGLLRERRIAEALGVSFFVPHAPEWLREPGRPFETWRNDLLTFCGFDPETVMLAAGRLEYLTAAGSEKAAMHELATVKTELQKDASLVWRIEPLVRFLIPGEPRYWEDADPRKAISGQTQAQIFDLLNGLVRDDIPFHELDQLLKFFEELRRTETKETLGRLLKHPSTTYAERAAQVLRMLGENIDPIAPAPPVRFRIFLNEEPWRSAELSYAIVDPKVPYLGTGSLKTDAEGFTTIPRDEFLDPAKRGSRLTFRQFPQSGNVWTEKIYDQAWIETEILIPKAYDEVSTARLTACRLPIEITYGSPPPAARKAATGVKLMKASQHDPNAWAFFLYFEDTRVEVPNRFAFSTIGPGMYQIVVIAPGSALHISEPFEVKQGMAPVRLKLEKGSDVYASILMPENARGAHEIRLIRKEEDITDQYPPRYWGESKPLYSGIPKGSYQLRILSTVEFMRKHNIQEWKAPEAMWQTDMRNGVDCEGLTVDFIVDDTTPPLLDLGRLENKPIDEMRKKAGPLKMVTAGPPPR